MNRQVMKIQSAPTSIAEIKANIFTFKTKHLTEFKDDETHIYEDDEYKVELKGYKLNQLHKDILDIVLYYGDNRFDNIIDGGELLRTISLYKIKNFLGHKTSRNLKWIEKKLYEMQQTLIQVTDKKSGDKWSFSIIHTAKHSEKLNTFAVVFHPLYIAFLQDSISMSYKDYLQNILKLENGVTKAAIRYLLTYRGGHQINIDKLLNKIGVKGGERNIRKQRKRLLDELQQVAEQFNIELIKTTQDDRRTSDYTIKYTQLNGVKFFHPQQISEKV